jgi:hypothetical protein
MWGKENLSKCDKFDPVEKNRYILDMEKFLKKDISKDLIQDLLQEVEPPPKKDEKKEKIMGDFLETNVWKEYEFCFLWLKMIPKRFIIVRLTLE